MMEKRGPSPPMRQLIQRGRAIPGATHGPLSITAARAIPPAGQISVSEWPSPLCRRKVRAPTRAIAPATKRFARNREGRLAGRLNFTRLEGVLTWGGRFIRMGDLRRGLRREDIEGDARLFMTSYLLLSAIRAHGLSDKLIRSDLQIPTSFCDEVFQLLRDLDIDFEVDRGGFFEVLVGHDI
jgi:hypothetical protein